MQSRRAWRRVRSEWIIRDRVAAAAVEEPVGAAAINVIPGDLARGVDAYGISAIPAGGIFNHGARVSGHLGKPSRMAAPDTAFGWR